MTIKDFYNSAAIAAYWNEYQETSNSAPFVGESFFPPAKKNGLDLSYIVGSSGLPVALAPSAFDALAPIRDRIGISVITGEMPYFKESFLIKEKDRQDLLRIQDSNDPYIPGILQNIFKDAQNLINGAAVTRERMRMQLLAPQNGQVKISVTIDGTNNMEYDYDPDGSWAASNYIPLSGTSLWTAYATADPLANLATGVQTVEDASGVRPKYVMMSLKTWNDLKKCASITSYIQGTVAQGTRFVSDDVVRELIRQTVQLEVIVYTKKFKTTQGGSAQAYYPDNYVTLLPDGELGNTWFGTTPHEADLNAGVNTDTSIVDTGVAVKVLNTGEHSELAQTQTFASEVTMPSFEGIFQMGVIKTA